jgi:hypothetical protein
VTAARIERVTAAVLALADEGQGTLNWLTGSICRQDTVPGERFEIWDGSRTALRLKASPPWSSSAALLSSLPSPIASAP